MKVLSTDKAPAAIGPYSQALVSGGTVFVSGQIPVDPSTGMIAETIAEQTAQSLSNIENILAENGMTIAIVKYDWKLERELAKEYRIDEQ